MLDIFSSLILEFKDNMLILLSKTCETLKYIRFQQIFCIVGSQENNLTHLRASYSPNDKLSLLLVVA